MGLGKLAKAVSKAAKDAAGDGKTLQKQLEEIEKAAGDKGKDDKAGAELQQKMKQLQQQMQQVMAIQAEMARTSAEVLKNMK